MLCDWKGRGRWGTYTVIRSAWRCSSFCEGCVSGRQVTEALPQGCACRHAIMSDFVTWLLCIKARFSDHTASTLVSKLRSRAPSNTFLRLSFEQSFVSTRYRSWYFYLSVEKQFKMTQKHRELHRESRVEGRWKGRVCGKLDFSSFANRMVTPPLFLNFILGICTKDIWLPNLLQSNTLTIIK